MNFYRAHIADISLEDGKGACASRPVCARTDTLPALPEEQGHIRTPALFVATMRDYVCRADLGKATMQKWAPHADVVELDTGHWAQYEATAELNDALEKWVNKLLVVD